MENLIQIFGSQRGVQGIPASDTVQGAEIDEALYADDAICIFENKQAMNRMLCLIEDEGGLYGMNLNKGKCEYSSFGQAGVATYRDGSPPPM